ncbi:OmpA family protein [Pseudomonas sp. R5(2019)]|uniref:OmpA family protein n=1 Tax=Pseudomonas sp. R5(2019) TaxID=2697566 RepID=UPI001412FB06|nr:OmpA family protein [Pseudomonas sp. R5(2019)]NBA94606.1 OmpA family protein [Pseudomonas sp. R5(2019)]
MSSHKSIALALCLAATGCAQTPQNSSADSGHSWWPFGADKVADKEVKRAAAEKVVAKTAPPAEKVEKKDGGSWWWPFGGDKKEETKALPKVDPKVTQAWLDKYEPSLREAIKDSKLELERRDNVLVITLPVDSSFNPDRPAMLLPNTLGPITRVAKILEADPKTAVLLLGHADTSGVAAANQKLSQERAGSVASIFRLSGLQRDRMMLRGMGGEMPRAANDSIQGRALNRRVEMLVTPQDTLVALIGKYKQPTPSPAELVAAKSVAPAAVKAPEKAASKAAPAKKATVAKKAPAKAAAKKVAPAKPAAKKVETTKKVATATDAKPN